MPANYQLSKIYTIINNVNANIYVGSTIQNHLSSRMTLHRLDAKTKNSAWNIAMRTIGAENFRIVLHHVFPCNSKDELLAEEMRVINSYIAAGTTVYNSIINGKPNKEVKAKIAVGVKAVVKIGADNAQFGFGSLRLSTIGQAQPKWRFSYRKDGKSICRSFATAKYGFWPAKALAEAERKKVYPDWKTDEEMAGDDLGAIEWD